jgi:hypothetical protein
MRVFGMRKKVAAFLVAGVALAACGGSGDSSSDTSAAAAGGRVKNVALTTVPAAATDLWSKSCADGGGCRLGEKGPGGGIVFYSGKNVINKVDGVSDGGVYLEFLATDKYIAWGCKNTLVPATTLDWKNDTPLIESVGKGAASSQAVVQTCPTDTAAGVALDFTNNGLSDWFLPSQGELNQLCWFVRGKVGPTTQLCSPDDPLVRTKLGTYEFGNKTWWSSNDSRHDRAWTITLTAQEYNGVTYIDAGADHKFMGANNVGVVRAFGVYAGEPPATTTTTVPPTCEKGGVCKVGDTGPGGGTVFYVGTSKIGSYGTKYPGGKYLEFIDPNPSKTFKFKCAIHVHDLKSGIGAGAENTARYRDVCSDSDSPVVLASGATNGGKSDWFIPSMEDLNQICRYSRGQTTGSTEQCNGKSKIVVSGNSFNEAQWSSDQFSQQSMYARSFGDGTSVKRDKNKYSYKFFLVRAFG